MTETTKTESCLNDYSDQSKLHTISEKVMDRFDDLLEYLGVDLRYSAKMYYGCCPVHGGDKWNALNLYHDGISYRGNWKCRTMQCEEYFKNSVIGFFRGILSHQKHNWSNPGDPTVSFADTIQFLLSFLNEDYDSLKTSSGDVEKHKFIRQANLLKAPIIKKTGITRDQLRSSLKIPSQYYIGRKYTQQILDIYDVGECTNPTKPMYERVVVPIYDADYKFMVGCTGRSIFEKCSSCNTYHSIKMNCPSKANEWKCSKWRHSKGFQGENHLYNYWKSKEHIMKTGVAVLVESPGNVWRLEEAGIHNSVGMFGACLSVGQRLLLDTSGALALILLTDNDSAGRMGIETITKECKRMYHIHVPKLTKNDVGDMLVQEVKDGIKPIVDSVVKELGLV